MRASGGTNFGLACSVAAFTKARIACLAAPSFHDGSGSLWACPWAATNRNAACATAVHTADRPSQIFRGYDIAYLPALPLATPHPIGMIPGAIASWAPV